MAHASKLETYFSGTPCIFVPPFLWFCDCFRHPECTVPSLGTEVTKRPLFAVEVEILRRLADLGATCMVVRYCKDHDESSLWKARGCYNASAPMVLSRVGRCGA